MTTNTKWRHPQTFALYPQINVHTWLQNWLFKYLKSRGCHLGELNNCQKIKLCGISAIVTVLLKAYVMCYINFVCFKLYTHSFQFIRNKFYLQLNYILSYETWRHGISVLASSSLFLIPIKSFIYSLAVLVYTMNIFYYIQCSQTKK